MSWDEQNVINPCGKPDLGNLVGLQLNTYIAQPEKVMTIEMNRISLSYCWEIILHYLLAWCMICAAAILYCLAKISV